MTGRSRLSLIAVCWSLIVGLEVSHAEEFAMRGAARPEADQLFRRDTRWRGSDAANSIDLGEGRVLWTFGDSFVDNNPVASQRQRKTARFIRNSIAIQRGYDPTSAEFLSYWQENREGVPTAFFRSEGEVFLWPGGGVLLDDKLLIYLVRVRNAAEARLGFAVEGWEAVLIHNAQDDPSDWEMEFVSTPQNSMGVMVGSGSSLRQGDWVYSFGSDNSRRHNLFLTRIRVADAMVGDFADLEWFNGSEEAWLKQAQIDARPPLPLVRDGQTEFTVHYEVKLDSFLLTQFQSFPRSPIIVREAQQLTGPWSNGQTVFVPEEATPSREDVMLYASKAHPEQTTEGLAVTYCTNAVRPADLLTSEELYYPRFVRFTFETQAESSAN